jgi:hypothetical protein
MLDRRALAAARGAARALPQLVARDASAPADHERHDRGRRLVLWPRLPIGHIPEAEVMGFAAHVGESDGNRR